MAAPLVSTRGVTDDPLVSVITPVLNSVRYVEACIQSALNQNYSRIEHIFIDGGSTDGTLEILSSYQAKYPGRIRVISEPDRGAPDAWNKGLKAGKGEIFGWLGADDTYEAGAVQTVVEFFRTNPGAYFVFGECNQIDEEGKLLCRALTRDFDLKEAINDAHYVNCPSAFYRQEVIAKVGLMDTSINACDLDYWIRVAKVFPMHRIDPVLANFRIHQDSVSGAKGADKLYIREGFIISRRHGGGIFSRRARRYYRLLITDFLRPVLGFAYPLIARMLRV